jgi:murein DD-endopeptidase MepM/ murein hydrolase activator NlpD
LSLLSKLRKVKSFFILIVPEQSSDTKSHKFSLSGIIVFLLGYSLLVSFLGYVFFSITPINELFFPKEKIFSEQEVARLNELNDRMISLSNELENLKSTNQRLRQAIMLGDSSILESLDVKRDTTSFTKKVGGSILSIIKEIFFSGTDDKKKIDYFVKPVNGFISREFNSEKGHIGIDFVVKTGTPVFAAANGYVIFADYTVRDGYMIIINHPNDYVTVYKHCSVLLKKLREEVFQGELISLSGNSGETTTGPHLHFEIWKHGRPINPESVFHNQYNKEMIN